MEFSFSCQNVQESELNVKKNISSITGHDSTKKITIIITLAGVKWWVFSTKVFLLVQAQIKCKKKLFYVSGLAWTKMPAKTLLCNLNHYVAVAKHFFLNSNALKSNILGNDFKMDLSF